MRWTGLLMAALFSFGGLAQAQIAAPRLNPVTIESSIVSPGRLLKPFNPATLSWSGPSRIGAATVDLEAEDVIAGVTTPAATGDGKMVQGRFVGEVFAIGAESYQFDLENTGGGPTNEFSGSMVSVALQFGNVFSIGAGQQSAEFVDPTLSETHTLPLVGATLRLGEGFFLGMATGDETVEFGSGGLTVEADRTVTRIGAAYRVREGGSGLHIEIFRETVDEINEPLFPVQFEEESDAFTVEIVVANVLIGFESIQTEAIDASGVLQEEVDRTMVSIGWAPETGLSIVVSLMEEEETDAIGDKTIVEATVVGVAWSF